MNDEPRLSGTVQIALRIPPELRERVKKAAEANNRSVNSELVATLEEKYPASKFSYVVLNEFMHRLDAASTPEEKQQLLSILQGFLRASLGSVSVYEDDLGDILLKLD